MEHLAAFGEESTDIGPRIHWASEDFGMFVSRLRLANETFENTRQSNGFLHSSSRRCWGKCLQVEGQVVFDRGRRLNRFHLESSADVGKRAGTKWQRLRVVSLPSLVFGTKVKGSGVLEVWR